MRILHAALPADWLAAQSVGSYAISSRGRTLAEEGFIHASTRSQLPGTLATFYADLPALVLLVLDVAALTSAGSPVRFEQVADLPTPFPHIYGPVPSSAVVAAIDVQRNLSWQLPDLSAYDVAH